MSTIQNIFITGASRGIGLEFVKQFLSKFPNKNIYATCRQPEKATALNELKQQYGDRLIIDQLIVEDEESIQQYISQKKDSVKFHTLINNAGIMIHDDHISKTTVEGLIQTLRVNTIAPLIITQQFYNNQLLEKGALVVNISSSLGSIDLMNEYYVENLSATYFISKAALNMASKVQSLALKDVYVVPLNPGWLKTDLGTENAPLEVEVGVEGIINVIENFDKSQNGKFLQYDGEIVNW